MATKTPKARKSTMTSKIVALMSGNPTAPKAELVRKFAKNNKITVKYAGAWYSYAVSKGLAKGEKRAVKKAA